MRGPFKIGAEQAGWKITSVQQDGVAPRYGVSKDGRQGTLTYYPLAGPRGLAHQNLGARLKRWDSIRDEFVVRVEAGRAQDGFYVIVPALDRLHKLGDPPLAPQAAIEALTAAAKALAAFQAAKIAHGEIDAWSIVKRQDGTTALLGPGLRLPPPGVDRLGLEVDPGYAAPEILDLRPPSIPSDMFSLGLVLYRFLSGKRPVQAKDPAGAFSERGKVPAPDLNASAPNAPNALKSLYAKLTAKAPAQRPQSAQELLADLAAASKGKVPQPNTVAVPKLEPDRIGGSVLVFVVAALIAGGLFHYTTNALALEDPLDGFVFPLEGPGYEAAPVTSASDGAPNDSGTAPIDSRKAPSDDPGTEVPDDSGDSTDDPPEDGGSDVDPVDSTTPADDASAPDEWNELPDGE